ncbi:retbindin isoform X1 [Gopherus flavomarginatus]|uniref:retbindin isoform X1 n=1 Tax=Gopherus flavomarginatus TaxID=286002 RepID=UPI0021CB9EFD|nr:retbindin isoform X1 [Gopherus flavomarginatus]
MEQLKEINGAMSGGGSMWALAIGWALAVLCGGAGGLDSRCLAGGKHKAVPSPEGQLGICQLYAANACCSPKVAQEISSAPLTKVNNSYWNRCGSLSPRCENYLQRVECFYRCSPSAARWPHPQRPTAILEVPLCLSFCEAWYEACKDDLTCARNWVSDWQWGPQGNNCSQDCVPYSQMYWDGRELCENIWGDSFIAAQEPCPCLSLTGSNADPLPEDGDSSEEPDSTKAGSPGGPCPASSLLRRGLRKRSVFMEDMEGSGSGV